MATKKAKREAALARRKQFLEGERLRGLAALEADRERRKNLQDDISTEVNRINQNGRRKSSRAEENYEALVRSIESDLKAIFGE